MIGDCYYWDVLQLSSPKTIRSTWIGHKLNVGKYIFIFSIFFSLRIWRDDLFKNTAGMGHGNRIFYNFCDFCFSWTHFRTHFVPCGHLPRGCSVNEKERSWKADMFRHKNFENRIKIEGVMALTLKIFQITHCMIHGPWKTKIAKVKKNPSSIVHSSWFFGKIISLHILYKKNKRLKKNKMFSAYIEFLAPKG